MPAKPKNNCWKQQLLKQVDNIPTEKRKALITRLESLIKYAVVRMRNTTELEESKSWSELAMQEHSSAPFSAILCATSQRENHTFPFQEMYDPQEGFPDCLSDAIHYGESLKNPVVFLENLKPLILSAQRMSMIDPYFNPVNTQEPDKRRWQRTVSKIAMFLREANRLTFDIHFHTSMPQNENDPEAFIKNIYHEISPLFPNTTSIGISVWSEKHQGPRFHARYIITDKAGISLDYGFDMRENQRTDISLMPLQKAKARLNEFNPDSPSTFELEATYKSNGTRPM